MAKASKRTCECGDLSIKGLVLTGAIMWGGAIAGIALLNWEFPSYAVGFLSVVDSIYPGYHAGQGFWSIVIGTLYATVDGAVAGAIFGWFYNWLR
jgi:hypothetical protein